eukprot:TRINITY_DN55364_c0_g1_i1.p1 TRINITY_DN55364_c0_g1~~TRINITY_DN55364_c0_g1_i1.p1  ORF type:complete len:1580 (+),score=416.83 TRINITY_DN55364_c0_g1_i1:312-4742(+)
MGACVAAAAGDAACSSISAAVSDAETSAWATRLVAQLVATAVGVLFCIAVGALGRRSLLALRDNVESLSTSDIVLQPLPVVTLREVAQVQKAIEALANHLLEQRAFLPDTLHFSDASETDSAVSPNHRVVTVLAQQGCSPAWVQPLLDADVLDYDKSGPSPDKGRRSAPTSPRGSRAQPAVSPFGQRDGNPLNTRRLTDGSGPLRDPAERSLQHRQSSGHLLRHECSPTTGGSASGMHSMHRQNVGILRVELDYPWRNGGETEDAFAALPRAPVGHTHSRFIEKTVEVIHSHKGKLHAAHGEGMTIAWGAQRTLDGSLAERVEVIARAASELHYHLNVVSDSVERSTLFSERVSAVMGLAQGTCLCGFVGSAAHRSFAMLGPPEGQASLCLEVGRFRGASVSAGQDFATLLKDIPPQASEALLGGSLRAGWSLRMRRLDVIRVHPGDGAAGSFRVTQSSTGLTGGEATQQGVVVVHQLLTRADADFSCQQLDLYERAFSHFLTGEFEQAADLIERFQITGDTDVPDPVAEKLLVRAQHMADQQPPPGRAPVLRYEYYATPPEPRDVWTTSMPTWHDLVATRRQDKRKSRVPAAFPSPGSGFAAEASPIVPEDSYGSSGEVPGISVGDLEATQTTSASTIEGLLRPDDGQDHMSPTVHSRRSVLRGASKVTAACSPTLGTSSDPSRRATTVVLPGAAGTSPPPNFLTVAQQVQANASDNPAVQKLFKAVVRREMSMVMVAPGSCVVTVVRASGLIAADSTTSDPYCVVDVDAKVGQSQDRPQTRVIKGTLDPEWDESFEFDLDRARVTQDGVTVSLTLWDWDLVGNDDFIGYASLHLSKQQLVTTSTTPYEATLPCTTRPGNVDDEAEFEGRDLGHVVLRVATGSAGAKAMQKMTERRRGNSIIRRVAANKAAAEKFSTQRQLDQDASLNRTRRILLMWNMAHLMVLMYNSFFVPVRAVFNTEVTRPEDIAPGHIAELVIDTFLDVSVYYVNIFLKFRTPYEEGGRLVSDPVKIRQNYLRTSFVPDLLGCFPVELIGMLADPVARDGYPGMVWFNPWYRIGRLLNILHLPEYLSMVFDRIFININPIWARIWRFLVSIFYVIHIVTCCHYAVLSRDYENGPPVASRDDPNAEYNVGYQFTRVPDLTGQDLNLRYTLSMDWAMHSLTGYSVAYPRSDGQTLLSLLCSVLGVFVYASVIAVITQLVQSLSAQEDQFRQRLDEIYDVLSHLKLPDEFRHQVIDFYKTLFANTGALNTGNDREEQLFSEVPGELKEKLESWLNSRILAKVPMFASVRTQPELMKLLLTELRPQLVTAGHSVCTRGEEGREMYFITKGECVVVDDDEHVVAVIPAGNFFGEICLFYDVTRTATICTNTFTQLYVLAAASLERVLRANPHMSGEIVAAAEARRPKDAKESDLLFLARTMWEMVQNDEPFLESESGQTDSDSEFSQPVSPNIPIPLPTNCSEIMVSTQVRDSVG